MSDIQKAHRALVERVVRGAGEASHAQRGAAFDNAGLAEPLRTLVGRVAHHASEVTDEDIAAATASGLSEDQIFEIVTCAAIGQATRQYHAALAALQAATEKE
jgi:hypothetical protein